MRHRRRYVAYEAFSNADKSEIYRAAASMCKTLGIGRTEIRVVVYDTDSRRGLLRCSHDVVEGLKMAMARDESDLRVLGVSGTIRAAKRKFLSQGQKDSKTRHE